VYVAPEVVILPTFHHCKIKGSVSLANLFEVRAVPTVTTKKESLICGLDDPGTPQCCVACKSPTREMSRGCTHKSKPFKRRFVPPIQFRDLFDVNAPRCQVGTHTERHEEMPYLALKLRNRAVIKVVVVIVRDDHCVNKWQ